MGIWTELLGLRVGIHDNFFELGGHSLLATQMTSRVRDDFGVELPLLRLFETPAIAELAKVIADLSQGSARHQAPAIMPVARETRRRLRSSLTNETEKIGGTRSGDIQKNLYIQVARGLRVYLKTIF